MLSPAHVAASTGTYGSNIDVTPGSSECEDRFAPELALLRACKLDAGATDRSTEATGVVHPTRKRYGRPLRNTKARLPSFPSSPVFRSFGGSMRRLRTFARSALLLAGLPL